MVAGFCDDLANMIGPHGVRLGKDTLVSDDRALENINPKTLSVTPPVNSSVLFSVGT